MCHPPLTGIRMTFSPKALRRLGFALLLSTTATCSGGDGPNPPDPAATDLTIVSGDGQTGQVGTTLADPLVVEVTDEDGNPVAGVDVQWAAGGGGSVSDDIVATDDDGRSAVQRVLGGTPGEQTTTATVSGLTGSPATFTAQAEAEPPDPEPSLTLLVQPPSSALTGEVWSPDRQPAVRLLDAAGDPVANAAVAATIASGSGTLEGVTTATTDDDGAAIFGDLGIAGTGSHTLQFAAGQVTVVSDAVALTALPAEAATGEWEAQVPWDIVPLHISMLPSGKLLAWGKFEAGGMMMGQPRLWNPAQGGPAGAPMMANDTMLFCAGHTLMADGRLMVSGGHKEDDRGLDVTNIFDPVTESWVPGLPKMAKGRWYPTVTTLADGRVVTVAGKDTTESVVRIPEIWEGNQWVQLPGANLVLPYYPRSFVDPKNGLLFYAGERITSRWLDVDGSAAGGRGRWIDGPAHIYQFNRDYGSAAMYETGKILYVGGGGDPGWDTPDPRANVPTATAEKIDLTATSPTWQTAGSMATRRRHLNATVLPDGTVLVTGGISGGGELNDVTTPVKAAELWDPATNEWTTLASQAVTRAYHSVALLMLDGTVLSGASGDAFIPNTATPYPAERNHEIFRPPYLFKGVRPTIADAPSEVSYGGTFTITTPNAAQIESVRWIRLPSVTHAFDANGRANTLSFERAASGVQVDVPSDPNVSPPGHYMVYILNRNGVPSTARIVRVH